VFSTVGADEATLISSVPPKRKGRVRNQRFANAIELRAVETLKLIPNLLKNRKTLRRRQIVDLIGVVYLRERAPEILTAVVAGVGTLLRFGHVGSVGRTLPCQMPACNWCAEVVIGLPDLVHEFKYAPNAWTVVSGTDLDW
jgi:hypothetical protein